MLKLIIFWLKYKRISVMPVEQYNTGFKYISEELDIKTLSSFLSDDIENADMDKLSSLYKQLNGFEVLIHIASCAIKPRFGKWKEKNRLKYCKDISRSINLSMSLSGFFLSNFGLKLPNLGSFLATIARVKMKSL